MYTKNVLYSGKKTTTDKYRFRINQGSGLSERVKGAVPGLESGEPYVDLIFVDGKFNEFHFQPDLNGSDIRFIWIIYGAVAEKIAELEVSYEKAR